MTEGELYLRQLRGLVQMITPELSDEEIDAYLAEFWADTIKDLEELGGVTSDSTKYKAWKCLGKINSERLRKVIE